MECCYRQRTSLGWTQGLCPKCADVVYAEARDRPFDAPAIWYKCEKVEVICAYKTPDACLQQRASS